MKIIGLEVHAYAPELNKLVFENGSSLNAPSCTTIKQAKRRLGFAAADEGGHAVIILASSESHQSTNREYRGFAKTLNEVKDALVKLRSRHNLSDSVIKVVSLKPVMRTLVQK